MRDRLFKTLQPAVSIDEYFEIVVQRKRLKNFFRDWIAPPRPDPKLQLKAYMQWLRVKQVEFVKEEEWLLANTLHNYHCADVRMALNERYQAAKQVLTVHLERKSKLGDLGNGVGNLAREQRGYELEVGFFAQKAAFNREVDEYVRLKFNDLHRGKVVIEQRLARKR